MGVDKTIVDPGERKPSAETQRFSRYKIGRNVLCLAVIIGLVAASGSISALLPLPGYLTAGLIAACVVALAWWCLRPDRVDERCPACGGLLHAEERFTDDGTPAADYVVCGACGLSADTGADDEPRE